MRTPGRYKKAGVSHELISYLNIRFVEGLAQKVLEIWISEFLEFGIRKSGIREFRNSGHPEIRNSGLSDFRKSEIPEFRVSKILKLRNYECPDICICNDTQ